MSKPNYMQRALLIALCGTGLWAGSAAAGHHHYDQRGACHRDHGAYLEHKWDRKGDRIERRLDRRAAELRAEGRYREARRLERKGDRIDRRLDRKGRRLHREWDRRQAARRHHRHERERRPVYVYAPPPWYGHHEPGVTIAFDLGRWVIRP